MSANNDIIYHYCSMDTFLKIIKNKEIWMTETKTMNDSLEGNLLNNKEYLLEKGYLTSGLVRIFDQYINKGISVACCFSSCGDMLSQWRGYAEDATGVAIGFSKKEMGFVQEIPNDEIFPKRFDTPNRGFFLSNIRYLSDEERNDCFDRLYERAKSLHDEKRKITEYFAQKLTKLSLMVKGKAFEEEKEIRCLEHYGFFPGLKTPKNPEYAYTSGFDYRATKRGISMYAEVKFSEKCVKEIILGPKNGSRRETMIDFTKSNNFSLNLEQIKRSKASYI